MAYIVNYQQFKLTKVFIVCSVIVGCGGSGGKIEAPKLNLVPVTGTLAIDGNPAEGVHITFNPTNASQIRGGEAVTDESGNFTAVTIPSKEDGIPAGEYRVTYSKFVKPDGSVLPPGTSPVHANAKESLPPSWSNPAYVGSHNTVSIPAGGASDLKLKVDTHVIAKNLR